MSDSNQKRPGCFKFGCCGCLLLVGLTIAAGALLGGTQLLFERGEGREVTDTLSRDLPTLEDFEMLTTSGELSREEMELRLGEEPPAETLTSASQFASFQELLAASGASKVVQIDLQLDVGEFIIERGEAGEGVVVETRYEDRAFVVSEEFEPTQSGGRMVIRAQPKGGKFGMMMRGAGAGPKNFLTIKLPPDVAFDLRGTLGLGESRVDLGGLLVRSVDLELGTGDHRIEFSEALLAPLESFLVKKNFGGLRIGQLGNASPKEVNVGMSIGDLWVDLRGAWRNDSQLVLANRVGKLEVEPATNARMKVDGSALLGEKDLGAPQIESGPLLEIELRGRIGEMTVHSH